MRTLIAATFMLLLPTLALANGYETYPTPLVWSPDSQRIAAVVPNAWPLAEDGITAGTLRLIDREGNAQAELVAGDSLGSPAFSPDSGMLICVYGGKIAEFAAPFDGASVKFIATPKPAIDCTFNRPGTDILASLGERFYGANIWRVSSDGKQLIQLTHNGSEVSAVTPLSLSFGSFLYLQQPGDNSAAYERLWSWNKGVKETEAIQFANPQQQEDYPDDYHESNPVVLSCDPLEIIFQRGGWGDWKLIQMGGDGVENVELPDAEEPSVSADGHYLAFVRRPAYAKAQTEADWEVIPEVWLADRQCKQLWHVETSIAGGEFPAVSPDGTRLAWMEYNGGAVQTRVVSVADIVGRSADGTY